MKGSKGHFDSSHSHKGLSEGEDKSKNAKVEGKGLCCE
jgi:hypothetical protein